MRAGIISIFFIFCTPGLWAQDGHQLWLPGHKALPVNVVCNRNSQTLQIAMQELRQGWQGTSAATVKLAIKKDTAIKGDGFRLGQNNVLAATDLGVLYGVFELLRRQQTGQPVGDELCNPSYERRVLNHWDNLNGSVERGYAKL